MRKQRATARRFPFQTITQSRGVDAHKQQVALSGEMFCGRFCDLRSIGKMDEAFTAINLRSAKYGSELGFPPQRSRTNFVKNRHWSFKQRP